MKINHLSLFFLLLLACGNDDATNEIPETNSRSFYMGFTAFPYAATVDAQLDTYEQVANNSDIFLNHLDHGVPWDEALNDLPFPIEVQNTLNFTKTGLAPNTKILLTATPADSDRSTLAKYWNDSGSQQELPAFWQNKTFDDPDVISAYIKYCRRVIDAVQPDYFAYGIETNAAFKKTDAEFAQFLTLAEATYSNLKADYPDLPIFLTLQDRSFKNTHQELLETSRMLLLYSDYVVMSTYPFLEYGNLQRDANPALFPDDWLIDFRNLDTNKPFAISETGFCAEDLVLAHLGIDVKGSEAWQAAYVSKLFNHSNSLDAEFIAWFVYRDYDMLYDSTQNPPDIFKVWRDNGLLDGSGNERPAFEIWKQWKLFNKN